MWLGQNNICNFTVYTYIDVRHGIKCEHLQPRVHNKKVKSDNYWYNLYEHIALSSFYKLVTFARTEDLSINKAV